jgi:hypothetical protein
MVVAAIDHGLERLVRVSLPLAEEVGDVSFEAPDRGWGAQLSRITVNLFLYDLVRSSQPARPAEERIRPDGRLERRAPLPMVKLSYLVTAWAGNTGDEHQLLSEVLVALVSHQTIPPEHLEADFPSSVQLALAQREGRRPGDLWSSLDGRLKPGLEIEVTVPVVSQPWRLAPPPVERIAGLVAPQPEAPTSEAHPRLTRTRREADGSLVTTPLGVADGDADGDEA